MFLRSPWLRRYLIFGTIFAVVHLVLFFGLLVFGMTFGDGPPTPANRHGADIVDLFLEILCFPIVGSSSAGIYLIPLNIIGWGIAPVGIWHAFSVLRAKTISKRR